MIKERFENKIKRYTNYIHAMRLNMYLIPYLEYIARCFVVYDFRWMCFNILTLLNFESNYYKKYKSYIERIIYLSNHTLENLFSSLKVEMFHSSNFHFLNDDLRKTYYYRVSSTNKELKDFFSYSFFIVFSISDYLEKGSYYNYRMCLHQNIVKYNSMVYELYPKTYYNPLAKYKRYDLNGFRATDLNNYPNLFTITKKRNRDKYFYDENNIIVLGNVVEDYKINFAIDNNESIVMGKFLEDSIKSTCKKYFDIFQNYKMTTNNDLISTEYLKKVEELIEYTGLYQNMYYSSRLINNSKDRLELVQTRSEFSNYVIDNGKIKYQYKPKIFSV